MKFETQTLMPVMDQPGTAFAHFFSCRTCSLMNILPEQDQHTFRFCVLKIGIMAIINSSTNFPLCIHTASLKGMQPSQDPHA